MCIHIQSIYPLCVFEIKVFVRYQLKHPLEMTDMFLLMKVMDNDTNSEFLGISEDNISRSNFYYLKAQPLAW